MGCGASSEAAGPVQAANPRRKPQGELRHPPTLSPYLTAPVLAAASLELKAEKQSAHSNYVTSVAFSPDGKTIVSGSADKTLKVWDAGVLALTLQPLAQT